MARIAPRAQAKKTNPEEGRREAMRPGVVNMPTPIIFPTTSIVQENRPNTRFRSFGSSIACYLYLTLRSRRRNNQPVHLRMNLFAISGLWVGLGLVAMGFSLAK